VTSQEEESDGGARRRREGEKNLRQQAEQGTKPDKGKKVARFTTKEWKEYRRRVLGSAYGPCLRGRGKRMKRGESIAKSNTGVRKGKSCTAARYKKGNEETVNRCQKQGGSGHSSHVPNITSSGKEIRGGS